MFLNLSFVLHILINYPKNRYMPIAITIPPNHSVLAKTVNANKNKINDKISII